MVQDNPVPAETAYAPMEQLLRKIDNPVVMHLYPVGHTIPAVIPKFGQYLPASQGN
jgi:hypothetical protein